MGPFLPHGREAEGTVDLGVRMRDQLLRGEIIGGGVRQVLADRLAHVAQSGRLPLSPGLVDSLLHTWPLAAMVDDAVKTWTAGPDPAALSVIARGIDVVSSALGWPTTVDRIWPMPDPDWIQRESGPGPHVVISRGPRDGAPAVASVLNAPLGSPEPIELPPVIVGQGDEITEHVDDWVARIEAGEAAAVRFETPVPWDRKSQAALARIRAATPAQLAFARYGHAGLRCPDVPEFTALLETAPPGVLADKPVPRCDALVIPYIDDDGRTSLAGALCWNEAYAPVLVHPFAVEVLRRLDGHHRVPDVARELESGPDVIESVLRQLTEIGAL